MPGSAPRIHLRSSAHTSMGQVRENNEDNVHLWDQEDAVLAIVADGMGGAAAGEEASRLAVEAIQSGLVTSENPVATRLDALADDSVAQTMRDIIRIANIDIMHRALANPDLRGMGTTVTLAFVRDMHAIVAHVGDSRAYLVSGRDRTIRQITADHSFVEALVAAGHITQEQAEDHPMRNVLYRALGQTEDIDVDVYHARLRPGDRIVLCSDGLTRHVRSSEIAEVALGDDDPERICRQLIDLANQRGGEDNVSVVAIVLEVPLDALAGYGEIDDTFVLRENITELLEFQERYRAGGASKSHPASPSAPRSAPNARDADTDKSATLEIPRIQFDDPGDGDTDRSADLEDTQRAVDTALGDDDQT